MPVTKDQAVSKFLAGEPIVFVEYRSSKAEVIKWRDKESRRVLTAAVLRHTVETDSGAIVVNERLSAEFPDEVAQAQFCEYYKSVFVKGSKVLLHLKSLSTVKGIVMADGALEAISK
jgi:hypothetical protein